MGKEYGLSLSDDFSGDEEKEIRRNLCTILETRAGSQPADREFGINWKCLDEQPDVAENLFALEAYEKIERYEPRVQIDDIQFQQEQGKLIPCLYFSKKEGEE